jgi:hypothetical protein
MSRNTSRLDVSYIDTTINAILHGTHVASQSCRGKSVCYYGQSEDQFIKLADSLSIPSLPIHHSMNDRNPPAEYREMVRSLSASLLELCPELIAETDWYFDSADIHTPIFYRLIDLEGERYLYQLLVDLSCRPLECEILEEGSNTRTHAYRTRRLYFECDYFPVETFDNGSIALKQSIPMTWKGEAGQGYMVHGIWMDADLNKFFSKLILPEGKRNYPYYPVNCKQHCVSMNAFAQESPRLLHEIRRYIEPDLENILESLQEAPFSERMDSFLRLKKKIPQELGARWENLTVVASLNEREQKEYTVEF